MGLVVVFVLFMNISLNQDLKEDKIIINKAEKFLSISIINLSKKQYIYYCEIPKLFGHKLDHIEQRQKETTSRNIEQVAFLYQGTFSLTKSGVIQIENNTEINPVFFEENIDEVTKSIDYGASSNNRIECSSYFNDNYINIPLARPGLGIYGHWLIDILPRLISFKELGESGSGLHNTIFSGRDTKVIVLQTQRQSNFIQAGLCYWCGQSVEYVIGESQGNQWTDPFSINIDHLREVL